MITTILSIVGRTQMRLSSIPISQALTHCPKSQHVRIFQEIHGASRYLKVLLQSSHCENPVSHHAIGTSGPRISQILMCPSRLVLFNTKKNRKVNLELHIQNSRLRDHTCHSLPCL